MQPPAPSSTTPAIWKISQVQHHVFFLSTSTIASANKEKPHSHLSPAPRAQREGPFPLCSLLQSWPHMTHRNEICNGGLQSVPFYSFHICCLGAFTKTFKSQAMKHIICLPHGTNHTLSQTIQKFLSSSQARQPQSTTVHKWSHSMPVASLTLESMKVESFSWNRGLLWPLNSSPCPRENAGNMHHWPPSSVCLRVLIFFSTSSLPGI